MQIVDRETGNVVQFEPGMSVESQFIEDCVTNIAFLGVGFGRTTAHVAQDVRNGIESTILSLKTRIKADGR